MSPQQIRFFVAVPQAIPYLVTSLLLWRILLAQHPGCHIGGRAESTHGAARQISAAIRRSKPAAKGYSNRTAPGKVSRHQCQWQPAAFNPIPIAGGTRYLARPSRSAGRHYKCNVLGTKRLPKRRLASNFRSGYTLFPRRMCGEIAAQGSSEKSSSGLCLLRKPSALYVCGLVDGVVAGFAAAIRQRRAQPAQIH